MALIHWLTLSLTPGIGPILARRLVEVAGSAELACNASITTLQSVEGIGIAKASRIVGALREAHALADEEFAKAAGLGVSLLCSDDADFPLLLGDIPDPPLVLYLKGALEPRDLNAIAIVGSRKCSLYGREQAERFAGLLAGAGFTIVSGGARGIDSSAHRGCLSCPQGRTLAVLGCGVDQVYPPENETLFKQIAERGAVLSEYSLSTPPVPENFPRRNRIVSGIARAVLVIEADERSGALITARQAGVDQNRTVLALPGRVDNRLSIGPHRLIRDGAILVTSLDDVLEALGPLSQMANSAENPDHVDATTPGFSEAIGLPRNLTERQVELLRHLDEEATSVDALVERSNLDASVVLQELTMLALKGAVRRVDGQRYARKRAT